MTRSFAAEDMVILPRLRTNEAVALTTALMTRLASVHKALEDKAKNKARKAKPGQPEADKAPLLPDTIMRRYRRLDAALLELRKTKSNSLEQDPAAAKLLVEADRIDDSAWGGVLSWCQGWARIPFHETENQLANKLISVLFSDGLKFTQLPYREQWAESQARIDAIAKHQLEGNFVALGGAKMLDAIRLAHEQYGRAQGITSVDGQEVSEPQMRAHLDALLAALRRYVMAVANHADPDVPGSEALAAELLEPLVTWKSRSSGSSPAEDEPDADPKDPDAQPGEPGAGAPLPSSMVAVLAPETVPAAATQPVS